MMQQQHSMLAMGRHSIVSAKEILCAVESDVADARKLVQLNQSILQDRETMISYLQEENHILKMEVERLTHFLHTEVESGRLKEHQLICAAEEHRSSCEGELDRALEDHQISQAKLSTIEQQFQGLAAENHELSMSLHECKFEISRFQDTLQRVAAEKENIESQFQDSIAYTKTLELALEEFQHHKHERSKRSQEVAHKNDLEFSRLSTELALLKTKHKDLQYELAAMKAHSKFESYNVRGRYATEIQGDNHIAHAHGHAPDHSHGDSMQSPSKQFGAAGRGSAVDMMMVDDNMSNHMSKYEQQMMPQHLQSGARRVSDRLVTSSNTHTDDTDTDTGRGHDHHANSVPHTAAPGAVETSQYRHLNYQYDDDIDENNVDNANANGSDHGATPWLQDLALGQAAQRDFSGNFPRQHQSSRATSNQSSSSPINSTGIASTTRNSSSLPASASTSTELQSPLQPKTSLNSLTSLVALAGLSLSPALAQSQPASPAPTPRATIGARFTTAVSQGTSDGHYFADDEVGSNDHDNYYHDNSNNDNSCMRASEYLQEEYQAEAGQQMTLLDIIGTSAHY